jgi:hypothetical protein
MAQVLPFPIYRRRSFIERQAQCAAALNPDACERHISRQMQVQRDVMLRKGVDPVRADRELKSMEAAIRAALWRTVLTPGAV